MEAFLLYFVLFFPSLSSGVDFSLPQAEVIPFSAIRELGRTLTYTIPSLALLWYLISGRQGISAFFSEKPKKQDFLPFIIGLPGLILISLGISLLKSLFSKSLGLPLPPWVKAPVNMSGWIVMVFSCLATGYLEESYFRYYLLSKLENQVPWTALRIGFAAFLFAACHFYEGPMGILNAVSASVLLSFLFIRYRSLHGIAWAHAAYNIFVYAMGIFVDK